MKIFKIMIRLITFMLITILLVNFYITYNSNETKFYSGINGSMDDLGAAIDILELWNSNYKDDNLFGNKIKQLIAVKILALRMCDVKLNKLKRKQLNSLARLIKFTKKIISPWKAQRIYVNYLENIYLL